MKHIYTKQDIEEQIKNACLIYQCLPKVALKDVRSSLSHFFETETPVSEHIAYIRPTPQEIDDADIVQFEWLPLLDLTERRLIWKRYSGMGWKRVAHECGISERTARRHGAKAIEKLREKVTKH